MDKLTADQHEKVCRDGGVEVKFGKSGGVTLTWKAFGGPEAAWQLAKIFANEVGGTTSDHSA